MLISLCNEVLGQVSLARQCELAAAMGYHGLEMAPYTLCSDGQPLDAIDTAAVREVVGSDGLVVTGLHWLLVTPEGICR